MRSKIVKFAVIFTAALVLVGCGANKGEKAPTVEYNGPLIVKIYEDIKAHLGESYTANEYMSEEYVRDVVGLNTNNVLEYIAEMPLIDVHVDTYISVLAEEGKADLVEKELIAYKDNLVENLFQYPMNIAKVSSAEVVRHGDYVFFVMLGNFDEREDVTEEEQFEFAQNEVKQILDIIEGNFKE